jgi:hypothetical protein
LTVWDRGGGSGGIFYKTSYNQNMISLADGIELYRGDLRTPIAKISGGRNGGKLELLISAGTTEARVGLVRTGPMMRPRWPHGSTRKLYFRHGVIAGTGASLAAEKGMTPAQNHRKLTAGMDFGSLVRTFER